MHGPADRSVFLGTVRQVGYPADHCYWAVGNHSAAVGVPVDRERARHVTIRSGSDRRSAVLAVLRAASDAAVVSDPLQVRRFRVRSSRAAATAPAGCSWDVLNCGNRRIRLELRDGRRLRRRVTGPGSPGPVAEYQVLPRAQMARLAARAAAEAAPIAGNQVAGYR